MFEKIYKLKRIIITTGLFFFLSNLLFAQPFIPKFDKLSLNGNGASLNQTFCILQDHNGFLWFGTMYGLVRYNGKSYKIYKNNPTDSTSISFDDIISLFEDKSGNIWIGTWGGGLNELNTQMEKFKRFIYDPAKKNGISGSIIWSVTQDSAGNIWIGTETSGLDKYNLKKNEFTNYRYDSKNPNGLLDNNVHVLYYDRSNTLWAGTRGGLSKFLPKENKFYTYINEPDNSNSISSNVVFSIYSDKDGNLWIGTAKGLNFYDINSDKFSVYNKENSSLSNNMVLSIAQDHFGNIWAGTSNGLNKLDKGKNSFDAFYHENNTNSLSGNNIISILEDKSGVLWVDAYQNGINKLVNLKEKFRSVASGLSGEKVSSFIQDNNGNIWIGTLDGGLNQFNIHSGNLQSFPYRPGDKISRLDSSINCLNFINNNLWIGTKGGLQFFDPAANKFLDIKKVNKKLSPLLSYNITSILYDKHKQVWIGTYDRGIYVFNEIKDKLEHYSYEDSSFVNQMNNYILTMYMDKSGQIWAGTYGGLMRFDKVGGKIDFYYQDLKNPNSLSNNYVYCIYQDKADEIWIGTANGLNLMNNVNHDFIHFFENNGLPNNVITSIREGSNGNLWLATNKGLSQFNPKVHSFRNFSKTDGLQSDIFYPNSSLKSKSGYLFFGGINGFNYFNPDSLKFSSFIPKLIITSFYSENYEGKKSEIKNFSNLQINHRYNTIHIEFSALDFVNTENIKYAFYLKGLEKNWNIPSSKNYVTYNDLPPGDYIFKVKSTNSDGLWSGNILQIKIDIISPFWTTWWFFAIIILILAAIIFFLYNFQLRLKLKHVLEFEKIREQESEKIRKKTAADFHDELGHTLTRISILTELAKDKINEKQIEVLPLLEKISENSKILYDGTKDFIWAIDPNKDTFYDLMIRLKDFGDDLFSSTEVQFQVNGITDELKGIPLKMDWKRQLSLLFKEGMNNALKHALCRQVFLEASILDQEFEISIVDDGKGFNPSEYFNHNNGLQNMRRRAEKISGILEFESKKGIGTKISFRGRIAKKLLAE